MKANRPIPELTEKDKARFWAKVNKEGPIPPHRPELGKCWIWIASLTTSGGYGNIHIQGKVLRANRISFELENGPLGDGLCALHHCDNPACIRPTHLFSGTRADNNRDMTEKGHNFLKENPEKRQRGDMHWQRRMPHLRAIGEKHWSKQLKGRLPRGEKHHNSKLSPDSVRRIRASNNPGSPSVTELARELGVSATLVCGIKKGKGWAHIKDD